MKASPVRRTRRKPSSQTLSFFRQSGVNRPGFFTAAETIVQRKCEACEAEEKAVQRKASGPATPVRQTAGYIRSLPGRGEAMSASTRSFFEARMGQDFNGVRIHRDAEAAQSAAALRAQAYTVGDHIVFNRGKYAVETDEGRKLLSHELVHVLQQRNQAASVRRVQMMPEDTSAPAAVEEEQKEIENKAPGAETTVAPSVAGEAPAGAGGAAAAKDEERAASAQSEKIAQPMTLPDFSTAGTPTFHTDFVNIVTFKGQTDAAFDGGIGQTKNLKGVPSKGCRGCADSECFNMTGTLEITYHVSTTVTLPDVPSGLTPCQEKRVRDAINNKIKPHEDQHVAAFETYNGAVKLPINFNGCKADLEAHVQGMHDANAAVREATARRKSAALDPFDVKVDLDCQDEPPKK
jgi:Domain of unknown function (DUF4157)